MKIYDCFLFSHELDLLEIRLNILNDYVDYFVIFEAGSTFSGDSKPYYLTQNAERFKPFLHKIIYIKNSAYDLGDVWANEWLARNLLSRGVIAAQPDDFIMLSDLDEIPRPELIKSAANSENMVCFSQNYHYYGLNVIVKTHKNWLGTVAGKRSLLDIPKSMEFRKDVCFQNWREKRASYEIVNNGGWHYSYLMSLQDIQVKLKSFSHFPELDVPAINNYNYLMKSIRNLTVINPDGPTGKGLELKLISIDNANTPEFINNNLHKYVDFIL